MRTHTRISFLDISSVSYCSPCVHLFLLTFRFLNVYVVHFRCPSVSQQLVHCAVQVSHNREQIARINSLLGCCATFPSLSSRPGKHRSQWWKAKITSPVGQPSCQSAAKASSMNVSCSSTRKCVVRSHSASVVTRTNRRNFFVTNSTICEVNNERDGILTFTKTNRVWPATKLCSTTRKTCSLAVCPAIRSNLAKIVQNVRNSDLPKLPLIFSIVSDPSINGQSAIRLYCVGRDYRMFSHQSLYFTLFIFARVNPIHHQHHQLIVLSMCGCVCVCLSACV